MIPIIKPNSPIALPKISTTRILMKVDGCCASAKAAPAPVTPTAILVINMQFYPHTRLEIPTVIPVQKRACPENRNCL